MANMRSNNKYCFSHNSFDEKMFLNSVFTGVVVLFYFQGIC